MQRRFFAVGLVSLFASSMVEAGPAPVDGGVRLAPHRAVYDLSLAATRGLNSVEAARGRIAFDLTGNACEGYGLRFRQVTVIDSAEAGSKLSDLRSANFESGDGRTFRYRNDSTSPDGAKKTVDGSAERRSAGTPLTVRMGRPRKSKYTLDDAIFPNAQMRDLIAAARAGRTLVQMKLFDGSDDGHKVYDTLAVIGKRIGPREKMAGLEAPARQDALASLSRWPVTISYFETGQGDLQATYILGFDMYENGVSRALRLDYGDFVLRGDLVRLDLLNEASTCGR